MLIKLQLDKFRFKVLDQQRRIQGRQFFFKDIYFLYRAGSAFSPDPPDIKNGVIAFHFPYVEDDAFFIHRRGGVDEQ